MIANKSTQIKAPIMENWEGCQLIELSINTNVPFPPSTMITQAKVKCFLENLNVIEPDLKRQPFAANAGWF
jgi:hypothetical protein